MGPIKFVIELYERYPWKRVKFSERGNSKMGLTLCHVDIDTTHHYTEWKKKPYEELQDQIQSLLPYHWPKLILLQLISVTTFRFTWRRFWLLFDGSIVTYSTTRIKNTQWNGWNPKMGASGLVFTCQRHSIGIKLLWFLSNVILFLLKAFIRQSETKRLQFRKWASM